MRLGWERNEQRRVIVPRPPRSQARFGGRVISHSHSADTGRQSPTWRRSRYIRSIRNASAGGATFIVPRKIFAVAMAPFGRSIRSSCSGRIGCEVTTNLARKPVSRNVLPLDSFPADKSRTISHLRFYIISVIGHNEWPDKQAASAPPPMYSRLPAPYQHCFRPSKRSQGSLSSEASVNMRQQICYCGPIFGWPVLNSTRFGCQSSSRPESNSKEISDVMRIVSGEDTMHLPRRSRRYPPSKAR